MTKPAIRVSHLSKSFRLPLDRSTTLKYRATHFRSASRYREFKALEDVSFDVPRGQFMGIAGPNGCGKSTLLKILSQIYEPDAGSIEVDGRISPFLELGVGFNPELTARENIFLGGAVLGLTRKELARRSDEIIEFAELKDFADQKIKNFSSGMGVRLAFSVAIQADADLLLMDEVLAVGDARFQAKCFDIFSEYKRNNRTIVLVSHDLGALNSYCDRVLLIDHGRVIQDGDANDVISEYRRLVNSETMTELASDDSLTHEPTNRWGTREIEITGVRLLNSKSDEQSSFLTGEKLVVAIDYVVNEQVDEIVCSMTFRRADGVGISAPNSKVMRYNISCPPPGTCGTVEYEIPKLGLLGAKYLLDASFYDQHLTHAFDHIEPVTSFHVVDDLGRAGLVDLGGHWNDSVAQQPTSILSGGAGVTGTFRDS